MTFQTLNPAVHLTCLMLSTFEANLRGLSHWKDIPLSTALCLHIAYKYMTECIEWSWMGGMGLACAPVALFGGVH